MNVDGVASRRYAEELAVVLRVHVADRDAADIEALHQRAVILDQEVVVSGEVSGDERDRGMVLPRGRQGRCVVRAIA